MKIKTDKTDENYTFIDEHMEVKIKRSINNGLTVYQFEYDGTAYHLVKENGEFQAVLNILNTIKDTL